MRRLLPVAISSSVTPRRHNTQVDQWTARLRYGSSNAPFLGSSNGDSVTHALYCKALLHASGGGRLARDWLAGWTSVISPTGTLLHIALQYESTEKDVERLRTRLLEQLAARCPGADVKKALGATPEVRCFVYDAMSAACFHRSKKISDGERQRIFAVAQQLGVDEETTLAIWQVVEKEGLLARKKQLTLDQPWSE